MKAENADWPRVLQINAASVPLAEAIFVAQCEAFGPSIGGSFRHLNPEIRQAYIQAAADLLRLLKPRTPFEFIAPDVIARVSRLMFHVVPND